VDHERICRHREHLEEYKEVLLKLREQAVEGTINV
jgi:hypothetical protein